MRANGRTGVGRDPGPVNFWTPLAFRSFLLPVGTLVAWEWTGINQIGARGASGARGMTGSAQQLVEHLLAAIAYRTQKALRDAPAHYPGFTLGGQVRTPVEILRHMTSVLGYARTFAVGGTYPVTPDPLPSFADEQLRFHAMLEAVRDSLAPDGSLGTLTPTQLLQGPVADVMTHVGQLAMLRRMAGSPVAPENFIFAEVSAARLGANQPLPARPDAHWPERPESGS